MTTSHSRIKAWTKPTFEDDVRALQEHMKACYWILKRWEKVIEARKQK